jgi:tRNA threonylcarbamoyladenosine biosynthesis protein TsaE
MTPTRTIQLDGPSATEAAGARLASCLSPGAIVTLSGDLGAGKTTFARGALHALGWQGRVKSPTYTLVEPYPLPNLYLYHIDFYRFDDPSEWETAGVADCFRDDAVCLVEWPERVAGLLPVPDVALTLEHAARPDVRVLTIRANSDAGERCARAIVTA